jgi:hypothetical protein
MKNTKNAKIEVRFKELIRDLSGVFFFKFYLKVGIEQSIVKAPLVSLQSKNMNNTKDAVS